MSKLIKELMDSRDPDKTKQVKCSMMLEAAIHDYIKLFEKKHDCEFEQFVGDSIIDIIVFGDSYFNMSDIIYDINTNQPKDTLWDWYDLTLSQALSGEHTINYRNYCK